MNPTVKKPISFPFIICYNYTIKGNMRVLIHIAKLVASDDKYEFASER